MHSCPLVCTRTSTRTTTIPDCRRRRRRRSEDGGGGGDPHDGSEERDRSGCAAGDGEGSSETTLPHAHAHAHAHATEPNKNHRRRCQQRQPIRTGNSSSSSNNNNNSGFSCLLRRGGGLWGLVRVWLWAIMMIQMLPWKTSFLWRRGVSVCSLSGNNPTRRNLFFSSLAKAAVSSTLVPVVRALALAPTRHNNNNNNNNNRALRMRWMGTASVVPNCGKSNSNSYSKQRCAHHQHQLHPIHRRCSFFSSSSSSSSVLSAVVPELDDSFPDDYDPNGFSSSSFELELPPPDDYREKEEQEVINPFSFPMPTFSYTEDGNTLESGSNSNNNYNNNNNNNNYDHRNPNSGSGAPFGVPSFSIETVPASVAPTPEGGIAPNTYDAGVGGDIGSGNDNDDGTSLAPALEDEEVGAVPIAQECNTFQPPDDSLPHPISDDSISPFDEDADPIAGAAFDSVSEATIEDPPPPLEPDDESLIPFASVVDDDSDPMLLPPPPPPPPLRDDGTPPAPLVAPLRLSKPSSSASDSDSNDSYSNDSSPSLLVPSIQANGFDDLVDSLQARLNNAEREIAVLVGNNDNDNKNKNDSKPINLNSPKQVSQLLFGRPDMSTNKETLEGMAGSNILAKLVLEYRDAKRKLTKALKDRDIREEREQLKQKQKQPQTQSDSSNGSIRRSKRTSAGGGGDPVLLFDTSSFIFRAYYSSPPIHRGRDGMPVGAVMGFCSMMNKILLTSMLRGETPRLIHCLDAPGASFRSELYPDYKAHRPPCPLDLVPQFELINKAARAYGMIQIQAHGYEADDVIATLATLGSQTEGLDVRILSGDKDLMQLVTEDEDENEYEDDGSSSSNDEESCNGGSVHMMDPMTSKIWNHEAVVSKWGVRPSQLGDVLALAGDKADNVPGVPGIGPKIAASLLQEFETLEALLEQTHKIPQTKRREKLEQHAESARISRQLVELKRDLTWSQLQAFYPPREDDDWDDGAGGSRSVAVSLEETTVVGDLRMARLNADRILAFYDEMGFFTLKQRLLDRLASNGTKGSGEANSGTGTNSNQKRSPRPKQGRAPAPQASRSETPTSSASAPTPPTSASTSTSTSTDKPKKKPKRNFWEKTTRSVPKPDEFKDVPF